MQFVYRNACVNKPQEKIAVFAQNCIQYLYTDFGAYAVRNETLCIPK